jgi:hypothetical protein
MTHHASRLATAVVVTLAVAATILVLQGRFDPRAVAGALVIGAGMGYYLQPRPGCWPFRRSAR